MALALTSIGTLADNVATTTTCVLTTTVAVAIGDGIVVSAALSATSGTPTCTDSAGNTYTRVASSTGGGGGSQVTTFMCAKASATLPIGGTITVTFGATSTGHMVCGYKITGTTTGIAVKDDGGQTSSLSPTVTVVGTAGDIAVGAAAGNPSGTISTPAGWTSDLNTTFSSSTKACASVHKTGTGSDTYNPTMSGGGGAINTIHVTLFTVGTISPSAMFAMF